MDNSHDFFEFKLSDIDPTLNLRQVSINVPDLSGLYLVFCTNEIKPDCSHLRFQIKGVDYFLIYFGKAGGTTNNGRVLKQGLKGRINNVVSDSHRNIKDLKRGEYWDLIMREKGIDHFYISYVQHNSPQILEDMIYSFLDINNLTYPYLNKKRGRGKLS
ncbi:hypothetical protein AO498_15045 [Algoriphagus sanaruensis]|uniref:Uncharacterized protein n=2 Tax=Algoriphagus sanaruensis TaxID=1727163 RepID=A0A142ERL4_9BACT|nr:hypothetical protein AO498_15045 [Algoriphagus sanaruensis]